MTNLQIFIFLALASKLISELLLAFLNLKRIHQQSEEVPEEVLKYMETKEWGKCSDYTTSKTYYSIFENFCSFCLSTILLVYIFPWYYETWSLQFGIGFWESSIGTTFFMILIQQLNLPFDWYQQFRLEGKFGFNNQSTVLWITDKLKELFLGTILLTFLVSIIQLLYEQISKLAPDFWWIFVFVVIYLLQIVLMILWPRFILPIFNSLKKLDDSELCDRLRILSERTGFKTKEILVMDGSKRSGHSNAFFTGFGKFRKIVLYDTLINQMEKSQIIAVVAHEIGHYKLGHIPKRLALSFFTGFIFFFLIAQFMSSSWFVEQLNIPTLFEGEIGPVLLAFVFFGGSISFWLSPLSNFFSRRHEFEADDYAVSMTESPNHLSSALKKLTAQNLSYPLPHPWVSFFYHSHPTLPERDLNITQKKKAE
jgi:STE24 endopeptidase